LLFNRLAQVAVPDSAVGAGDQLFKAALVSPANLGVLLAASGVGLMVARGMKAPHYLVMAAVVGAVTDLFNIGGGPGKHLMEYPQILAYLSYQWGLIGSQIGPCVGMGDFIFLALYFAGARKFHLDERKTLAVMILAFAVGFFTLLIPDFRGVPALPFMGAGLLAVHAGELRRAHLAYLRQRETAEPATPEPEPVAAPQPATEKQVVATTESVVAAKAADRPAY
jgi:hypothetical protein